MGDRAYTQVDFRSDYLPIVKAWFAKNPEERGLFDDTHDELQDFADTVCLTEHEANWGEMSDITDVLDVLCIPYNRTWESGYEFGSGTWYQRFDEEGNSHSYEIYDTNDGSIQLLTLQEKVDAGGTFEEIKELLKEGAKKYEVRDGRDISKIPLRKLTDAECALIMEYKMGAEVEPAHGWS